MFTQPTPEILELFQYSRNYAMETLDQLPDTEPSSTQNLGENTPDLSRSISCETNSLNFQKISPKIVVHIKSVMLAMDYVDSVELRSEKSHGKSELQFIVKLMPARELLGCLKT